MRKCLLALGLFFTLAVCCLGASQSVQPSCPRVIHYLGNQTMPCSGVLVWKSDHRDLAQVVTAGHLFSDGVGTVAVHCADGKRYRALVVHVDRQRDFAVLHIRRPLCRAIRFAARLPVAGAKLLLGGYPRSGRFRWHGGRLGRWHRDGSCTINVGSEPGDSGGPILNADNELVGLISATRPGETIGPGVTLIAAVVANCRQGVSTTTTPYPSGST